MTIRTPHILNPAASTGRYRVAEYVGRKLFGFYRWRYEFLEDSYSGTPGLTPTVEEVLSDIIERDGDRFARIAINSEAEKQLIHDVLGLNDGAYEGVLNHDYLIANITCSQSVCSSSQLSTIDALPRYSLPGHDPNIPVADGNIYRVYTTEPFRKFVGRVTIDISDDRRTITNTSIKGHLFHDGIVERRAFRLSNGDQGVLTHGYGRNEIFGMDKVNQYIGPRVFDALDTELRDYLEGRSSITKDGGY